MRLPKDPEFELKQEHIDLIAALNFCPRAYWEDGLPDSLEFVPEISQKRPFGNSGVLYDVAQKLGLLEEQPDGDMAMTPAAERLAMKYVIELPVALEIVVTRKTFQPGIYRTGRHCAYFAYRSYMSCWFWLDAVKKCAGVTDGNGDGLFGRAFDFCRAVPDRNPYGVLRQLRQWAGGQPPGSPVAAMYGIFRDWACARYVRNHPEAAGWDPGAIAAVLIDAGDPADTEWPFWDEEED